MPLKSPIAHDAVTSRLAAIVLAAGASSRMGALKPLLPLAGTPALEHCIATFHRAGVENVLVVTGNRADEVRSLAERCSARCVDNPHFLQGMYSSVLAGVAAVPGNARGAFILPADIPLVSETTIRRLAYAFLHQSPAVVYPVFAGHRGHPPLLARAILDAIVAGASGPLCIRLEAYDLHAIDVPVDDEAIHLDMDTPADLERLSGFAARRKLPGNDACEALLAANGVPEAVRRHSRKVADVALSIAQALRASGLPISLDLTRAGSLLHDLAKGVPDHAEAGAQQLRRYGLTDVAAIVAAHHDLSFSNDLDERAIVYLADKLVSQDQIVSLQARFQRSFERLHSQPEALEAAQRRKLVAESIARAIEIRTGRSLAHILNWTEDEESDRLALSATEEVSR